jgi:MFS family permease
VTTPEPAASVRVSARGQLLPLYAAGFVTAFGAHSIAASLGGYTHGQHASLLALGLLLAVYDGAEVALKPVFGSLADRVGARPVLLGGLLAVAAAGWPGSARAPRRPRSPRRPRCWYPGLPRRADKDAASAATAPGKAWATHSARYWAGC